MCWSLMFLKDANLKDSGFFIFPVCRVEVPPENLLEVLKVLEADYREMREKIQAGIPLDQLKPLAVDSQKITSATCYIPSQVQDLDTQCDILTIPTFVCTKLYLSWKYCSQTSYISSFHPFRSLERPWKELHLGRYLNWA